MCTCLANCIAVSVPIFTGCLLWLRPPTIGEGLLASPRVIVGVVGGVTSEGRLRSVGVRGVGVEGVRVGVVGVEGVRVGVLGVGGALNSE